MFGPNTKHNEWLCHNFSNNRLASPLRKGAEKKNLLLFAKAKAGSHSSQAMCGIKTTKLQAISS